MALHCSVKRNDVGLGVDVMASLALVPELIGLINLEVGLMSWGRHILEGIRGVSIRDDIVFLGTQGKEEAHRGLF